MVRRRVPGRVDCNEKGLRHKPIGESECFLAPVPVAGTYHEAGGWIEYELQPMGNRSTASQSVHSSRCRTPIPTSMLTALGSIRSRRFARHVCFRSEGLGRRLVRTAPCALNHRQHHRQDRLLLESAQQSARGVPQSPSDCDVHDASRRESHEQTPIRSAVAHRRQPPRAE